MAQVLGVPVVIYRTDGHPSLLGPGTHQFESLSYAMEFIKGIEFKPKADRKAQMLYTRTANASPPLQAHSDDAGFDLVYNGVDSIQIPVNGAADIPCGVSVEFPPHTWGFLVGRSSSFRQRGVLVNPAVIDPGFRGELFAIVRNISTKTVVIEPGERVAQIVPLPALAPKMQPVEVQHLSATARGSNGFGSTGK
jgi:dUTP pyrophosphatase